MMSLARWRQVPRSWRTRWPTPTFSGAASGLTETHMNCASQLRCISLLGCNRSFLFDCGLNIVGCGGNRVKEIGSHLFCRQPYAAKMASPSSCTGPPQHQLGSVERPFLDRLHYLNPTGHHSLHHSPNKNGFYLKKYLTSLIHYDTLHPGRQQPHLLTRCKTEYKFSSSANQPGVSVNAT